jgi:hypothetical protein
MDANERKFKDRLIRVYSSALAVEEVLAKKQGSDLFLVLSLVPKSDE